MGYNITTRRPYGKGGNLLKPYFEAGYSYKDIFGWTYGLNPSFGDTMTPMEHKKQSILDEMQGTFSRRWPSNLWLTQHDYVDLLGLVGVRERDTRDVINSLIHDCVLRAADGRYIRLPLGRSGYAKGRSRGITYRRARKAYQILSDAELIYSDKAKSGFSRGVCSRITAAPVLIEEVAHLVFAGFADQLNTAPPVLFRDADKAFCTVNGGRTLAAHEKAIRAINSFNAECLDISFSGTHFDRHHFRKAENALTAEMAIETHLTLSYAAEAKKVAQSRIFALRDGTQSPYALGGRLYRPGYQSVPKQARDLMLINGEETEEFDLPCLHPNLIASCLKRVPVKLEEMERKDFYEFGGADKATAAGRVARQQAKWAVNIQINADKPQSGVGAIAAHMAKKQKMPWPMARSRAQEMAKLAKRHNPELKAAFNSGIGIKLQRIDGDISVKTQAECHREGIPVMNLHDGFRARKRDIPALQSIVEKHLYEVTKREFCP